MTMGSREEQAHGHSQAQHHGKAHQGLLEALISQLFSSHWSNLEGASVSPSSGERSADRIRAFTPTMLEPKKF